MWLEEYKKNALSRFYVVIEGHNKSSPTLEKKKAITTLCNLLLEIRDLSKIFSYFNSAVAAIIMVINHKAIYNIVSVPRRRDIIALLV